MSVLGTQRPTHRSGGGARGEASTGGDSFDMSAALPMFGAIGDRVQMDATNAGATIGNNSGASAGRLRGCRRSSTSRLAVRSLPLRSPASQVASLAINSRSRARARE
jgi:hypothetical protein